MSHACKKYLHDNYGDALAKAINFGNLQQCVPAAITQKRCVFRNCAPTGGCSRLS